MAGKALPGVMVRRGGGAGARRCAVAAGLRRIQGECEPVGGFPLERASTLEAIERRAAGAAMTRSEVVDYKLSVLPPG
jgi:hypothetical protein